MYVSIHIAPANKRGALTCGLNARCAPRGQGRGMLGERDRSSKRHPPCILILSPRGNKATRRCPPLDSSTGRCALLCP